MKILAMNWKDIKHPLHGGAEIYTHEILKRLAKKHDVTLFTSRFKDCKKEETIDDVKIVRGGNRFTVYWKAYNFSKKTEYDLIIDEINTIPFFTPLYSKKPVVALIHQLAGDVWEYEVKPPFSWLGKFLEPLYLRMYRNKRTITVSNSVADELINLGFNEIHVVPNGMNIKPMKNIPKKSKNPTLLYLGRIGKSKRPEHAIKVFKNLKIKNLQLYIAGTGDNYFEKLKNKYESKNIKFFGRVSEKKKHELLKEAHVLIVPSVKEGWGRVVIEANAFGTPAVGYNVTGLIDSIKNNETGFVVENGNIKKLIESCEKLLADAKLRSKFGKESLKWAKQFSWDKSAKKFEENLADVL